METGHFRGRDRVSITCEQLLICCPRKAAFDWTKTLAARPEEWRNQNAATIDEAILLPTEDAEYQHIKRLFHCCEFAAARFDLLFWTEARLLQKAAEKDVTHLSEAE
ncbi:MAG: hypothetical protein AB9869_30400 [Verrucomicrobiia bacterium]